MVEGKGFTGRLEERHREKSLKRFIKEKDNIIIFPDVENTSKSRKKIKKEKRLKR